MFDPREVGRRIQERRKQKGLTQEQLAQAVCISVQAVSRWENGESMPNIGTFPALCKTLGASADALLGNHPTSNPAYPVHPCFHCHEIRNNSIANATDGA